MVTEYFAIYSSYNTTTSRRLVDLFPSRSRDQWSPGDWINV